jgi:Nuclease-related domain
VIGPGGVFAIETKTRSIPTGRHEVRFDGKHIWVDGYVPDRDPVAQVHACAASLRRILKEYSGLDVEPHPVILFPGRYVVEANKSNL